MTGLALLLAVTALAADPPAEAAAVTDAEPTQRACDDGFEGPVRFGFYDADVGASRHICPRTEIGLSPRAGALIHTDEFYGALTVDAQLFGSYALDEKTELFATIEIIRYDYVVNAVIKGSAFSLGQSTLGFSRVTSLDAKLRTGFSARLLLPTSFIQPHVRTTGVDAQERLEYTISEHLQLHGFVGSDFSLGLSAAPSYPWLGLGGGAGLEFAPWRWLGLVLDVNAHYGLVRSTTWVAPAVALRFNVSRAHLELGGTLPVLGNDRHNFIGALRFEYEL